MSGTPGTEAYGAGGTALALAVELYSPDLTAAESRPAAAACNAAIKCPTQYERPARKYGVRIPPKRLKELDAKRDAGSIRVYDLPATLRAVSRDASKASRSPRSSGCAAPHDGPHHRPSRPPPGGARPDGDRGVSERAVDNPSTLAGRSADELQSLFLGSPPIDEDPPTVYFQEVAIALRATGASGLQVLLEHLGGLDEDRTRAAILAATFPPPDDPAVRGLLLSLLRDERALVLADAIDGLARLPAPDAAERVMPLGTHGSPYVRAAVLRFLGRRQPERAQEALLGALNDLDYIVRESAVDLLEELGIRSAVPALRALLADPHPDVQQAASTAIQNLERLA